MVRIAIVLALLLWVLLASGLARACGDPERLRQIMEQRTERLLLQQGKWGRA